MDPRRGGELAHNPAECRSIHTDKFSHGMVCGAGNSSRTATVEAIGHRKSAYKNMKRLHE